MSESIKIAVRIRPQNKREKGQACIVKINKNQLMIKPPANQFKNQEMNFRQTFSQEKEEKCFEFSRAYWSYDDSQKLIKNTDVYKDFGDQLINNVFDGYNSTIFAYGQTGSGKSYTIEGQQEEKGILQHCLFDIFERKKTNEKKNIETKVFASYLEIYKEDLRDLLDPTKKNLKIFSTSEGVMVQNLSRVFCENLEDVMNLLQEGKKIRVVGSHAMNIKSSRSHAIFIILVIQKEQNQVKIAKLNIVDLAGSERYSKTQSDDLRLQEASNINKSLTFLGLVIENLAQNQTKGQNLHIPYRNSQLTHLLSESLCGNSKTFMIANISGAEENYEETVSTLRFAERVQCIKTNSKQNITDNELKQNQALEKEIEKMKKQIVQLSNQVDQSKNQYMIGDNEINDLVETQQALEDELKNNEMLLDNAQTILEKERHQKNQLEMKRNQILREAGIQLAQNGNNQAFDAKAPYLMNMSDDPSQSGCLLYYLKMGQNRFGTASECEVQIQGLGIRKQHCIIKNDHNQKLTIYMQGDSRVILNGAVLDPKSQKPTEINHLDRLHIGHEQAFKVIIPKLNKNKKIDTTAQNNEDFMKGRLGQSNEQSKQLKKFIDDLKNKLPESQFHRFLDQIQIALDNIDKANEITLFRYRKFPLKQHNIYFNLDILTSVVSDAFYNLQFSVSIKNRDDDSVQFMWTYDRFASRLDDMILWYSHENRGQDLQEEFNPWRQTAYQKDLNKMTTKQLYKHYYGQHKYLGEKMQVLIKQKDKLVMEIQKLAAQRKLAISEVDIEGYADVYFRAFDQVGGKAKFEQIKKIQNINYYIKNYMELCAEISHAQIQKYENQQQIDKILLIHKRNSQKSVVSSENSLTDRSENSNIQTQNTFYSANNNQQMITQKQPQEDQLQQQYIFQQRLIPQQQQLISQLQQRNLKLKKQVETLMS